MEELINAIRSYVDIDQADLNYCLKFCTKKSITKGMFLLQPGQLISQFYFVLRGCVSYYELHEGSKQIMEFYTEGYFFTDMYAYTEGVVSEYYLEALEDCELYIFQKSDLQKMYDHSHQFERFGRLSMQRTFIVNFRHIQQLKNRSNEERYLQLLEKRPGLVQRIPQYLIASYLGITPVGLSKIRKRLSGK